MTRNDLNKIQANASAIEDKFMLLDDYESNISILEHIYESAADKGEYELKRVAQRTIGFKSDDEHCGSSIYVNIPEMLDFFRAKRRDLEQKLESVEIDALKGA